MKKIVPWVIGLPVDEIVAEEVDDMIVETRFVDNLCKKMVI